MKSVGADEVENCVFGWIKSAIAAAISSELARISSAQQIYSAHLADLIAFACGKCLIPTQSFL